MHYKIFITVIVLFFLAGLCSTDRVNLGEGYYFYKDRKDILGGKTNGVPPIVEHYWKNSRYILVRQHPKWPPEAIYGTVNYPYGYGMKYYWVIDKEKDTIQGPMDSISFYKYIRDCSLPITQASQLPVAKWYDYIAEPTLADAILDRLLANASRIESKGDSLRRKNKKK